MLNRCAKAVLLVGLTVALAALCPAAEAPPGAVVETPEQTLAAGKAALEDGLFTLAEKYFDKYIKVVSGTKERAEGVLWLARALYGQGRFDDTLNLLKSRAKWAAGTPVASGFAFWRAMAQFEQGNYDVSLKTLDTMADVPPDDPWFGQALRLRAKCYVKLDQSDRAAELFERFQKEHPLAHDAAQNLLDWAGTLIQLGRTGDAAAVLQDLATGHGDSLAAHMGRLWLGELHLEQSRWSEAGEVLRQLGEEAGAPPDLRARAFYALAEVLEAQTNFNEALSAVEQGEALAVTPDVKVHGDIFRSRLLVILGRTEEGAALLHEWVAANPEDPMSARAQLELAQSLLDRGRFEQAEREFQHYLEAFADEAGRSRALLGKGWSLFEQKRYPEAAAAFEKAQGLAQDDAEKREALFKAADAYFGADQFKLAREKYIEVTRVFPGSPVAPQALFQAAECLARLGDAAAEEEFRAIEDAFPDSPFAEQAAMRIALLKEDQGRWEDALAAYRRLMKNYPDGRMYARALHGRALIQYRLGQFARALRDFEQVLKDYPTSAVAEQAFYMRGWCLHLMGQSEEALGVCREFIQKYPASAWAPDVLFWLAEYHFNRGEYAESERRFLELADKYAQGSLADDAVFWAGRAAMAEKQYLRAIEHFNRLTQACPDSPKLAEARFLQGDALSELGQFSGAIVAFEEVIKKYPDSYLAELARGRKGDCQFTLGSEDPRRYNEALESYRAVLNRPAAAADLKLQAEYKIGRCREKMGHAAEAFEHYMNVVYGYLSNREKGGNGGTLWFTRAAFNAAAIKEAEGQLREAVSIYTRVADAGIPASDDARQRIQKLRIEHWFLL
ncbi:MAG: tetratricopeptide repeat protein [Kiritimatiellae bacterium]|nr:tetratricopeptide repeat protein [Kiritimatiellia bacterium]